ncbi:MAG: hypothetical protein JSS27_06090 [Planctomycetes bacterium]|nr:hypothetical protein [Planctomycetota bacterium]
MHEQLIGYLLHSLKPEERQALETELRRNPDLRAELERLRQSMFPEDRASQVEPPPGLAARTCSFVSDRVGPKPGQFGCSSQWRVQDVAIAAGVLFVIGMLLFPAFARSRYHAQLRGCRHNLRELSQALLQFSDQHGGYFPEIPAEGKLAVAGIYAPKLIESGWLDERHIHCPAMKRSSEASLKRPTLVDLNAASGQQLQKLQKLVGGSYGYSLGYVSDGRYHRVLNRQRSSYALMADAPAQHAIDSTLTVSSWHECRGQNVLFEDGHVEWLTSCHVGDDGDHIFTNRLGVVGAGIGPDDAVIGASDATPISTPVLLKYERP